MEGFTIKFLRDGKFLVKFGQSNFHYTFQPGRCSGIVDVHKTDERIPKADPQRHQTLIALPKLAIEKQMCLLGPDLVIDLVNLWRPLHLGWMIRHRLGVGARLLNHLNINGIDKISVKTGSPACNEPFATWLKPPRFYEDILRYPDSAYLLFDCKKRSSFPYGVTVTYRGRADQVQMRWAKVRDLQRWAKKWEPTLLASWEEGRHHFSDVDPASR